MLYYCEYNCELPDCLEFFLLIKSVVVQEMEQVYFHTSLCKQRKRLLKRNIITPTINYFSSSNAKS